MRGLGRGGEEEGRVRAGVEMEVRNSPINPPREIRNPILEIMVRHLHHVRLVLDDRHVGRRRHLARGVAQAVLRGR